MGGGNAPLAAWQQHLEECADGCGECLERGPFERERYEDVVTWNMAAGLIVLDMGGASKQGMFGGRCDTGEEGRREVEWGRGGWGSSCSGGG